MLDRRQPRLYRPYPQQQLIDELAVLVACLV